MSPLNVVLLVVVVAALVALLVWTEEKRKATKILVWTGFVVAIMIGFAFMPDEGFGPATWGNVADLVLPDGYSRHSVETSISMNNNWIVGETKECKSYPLIPVVAKFVDDESGYAAGFFHCGDGATHTVKVDFYGRLNQPEHRVAFWQCTRESESFTCRQTGAE